VDLPEVDTAGWRTYENESYGYSFRYPLDWVIDERDSGGLTSPTGQAFYPKQATVVQNPVAEQGENVAGVNCAESSCIGIRPYFVGFYVSVENAHCSIPSLLVSEDTVTLDGKPAMRCVFHSEGTAESYVTDMALDLPDDTDFLVIAVAKGREVSPEQQATLEAVLASFRLEDGH
jgi:hypothetical protein